MYRRRDLLLDRRVGLQQQRRPIDLRDRPGWQAALDELGAIDLVVHCAGTLGEDAAWAVNVDAPRRAIQTLHPRRAVLGGGGRGQGREQERERGWHGITIVGAARVVFGASFGACLGPLTPGEITGDPHERAHRPV